MYSEPPVPSIFDTGELMSKADLADFYLNVTLRKAEGKIYIPCGVGTTDNGFFICGIPEVPVSNAPGVFALVYNYLTRSSTILPEDYPHYLRSVTTAYQINYQRVFRLMMVILQLIRHGAVTQKLDLSYDGSPRELRLAADILNDYVSRFSRLLRLPPPLLTLASPTGRSLKISLDQTGSGIYVENNRRPNNARELWYGEKINYRLDEGDLEDLEYLLGEISPFSTFKEGQFSALTDMLNAGGHAMCILPTGSGKSLIFYFASLLQPLPIMILAPTEILIDDQIRNLKKFHHLDNVSHLKLTGDCDFSDFQPCTSLIYLTPATFQCRNLLVKCRHMNDGYAMIQNPKTRLLEETKLAPGPSLAYVVLDEIHCLSNWGHDFRPEYLMLSKFLNKFLSRVSFLGFTATANYTVVEDIQNQLSIPQQNIISPVSFEKYNLSYQFRAAATPEEMLRLTCEIVSQCVRRGERTLVFAKSEETACRLAEAIGCEADVFQSDNPGAYHMFAEEKCRVLVASADLGIGINLPNIRNVLHFGLPVSKNEYVQEIGRAGRGDEAVTSYVVYLQPVEANIPPRLLARAPEIPDMADILAHLDNDYTLCFRKLSGHIDSKEALSAQVLGLYRELSSAGRGLYVKTYPLACVEQAKKYLYMLYAIGYVFDWYACSGNDEAGTVDILIDISSANHAFYSQPRNMLHRVRQRAVAYYDSLGDSREQIAATQRAGDIETVIQIYIDWYYRKFLYHHRELFLDLLDFIEANKDGNSEQVTEEIREYFSLPFVELKSDEIYYTGLTLSGIGTKVAQGIGRRTLANAERISSRRYAFNLDCLLLLGTLKLDARFDKNRFLRIMSRLRRDQEAELRQAFHTNRK